MREDPIVAEIRRFRAEHAAKYGHDLDRICEVLREKQAKSKRRVVTRNPRLLVEKPTRKSVSVCNNSSSTH
uniref:Uncharacterized protein n=2 Tax=unclassified Candidatus Kentrum TaxID=2643149 RepID=A0A451AXN9_9GAMM|nr:MAG: hypothetical protein BECKLPF1236B_GA0070989_11248 [Candidatus Kentron sp. LPFa]VFK63352.1 MAG: hypothetical protein BECKUNK1418G_GA0071005_103218 [Candidatus Kentron sp. UNK]VFK70818.1 MAG: hypothetical protein BECKUNK1418H_GA0071006_103918 [Candidatus Kentron sp. UNK]